MLFEKSCGFVVYKETNAGRQYLIIQASHGEYGFPKGHTEEGETELETAIRELKEETDLQVQVIDGFRREIAYRLKANMNITKQAVYFLGKCTDDRITLQESELLGARFLPLDQALAQLSFDMIIQILKEADAYLDSLQ